MDKSMNRKIVRYALIGIVLSCGATMAVAQSFPKIKAGLWESTVTRDKGEIKGAAKGDTKNDMPATIMCIDDTVMEQMMKMGSGMAQKMCTKNVSQVSGNKFTHW